MREKKFRIWDIETKQFFYWGIAGSCPTCLAADYIKEATEDYTGRKDKSLKEIYEGDIVQAFIPTEWDEQTLRKEVVVVEWDNGKYVCKSYLTSELYELYNTEYQLHSIEWEIVGNKHENPELMKTKVLGTPMWGRVWDPYGSDYLK